jgi:hypothetical protein
VSLALCGSGKFLRSEKWRWFKLDQMGGELLLARRLFFGLNKGNGKYLVRCPFKAFKI